MGCDPLALYDLPFVEIKEWSVALDLEMVSLVEPAKEKGPEPEVAKKQASGLAALKNLHATSTGMQMKRRHMKPKR